MAKAPHFEPPDWLSTDDAFAWFLKAARGDPALAARELQQVLENDLLKSGYVRMPTHYRESSGALVWIPEHEERGLLSYQFWRSEARVHDLGPGIRCVPRPDRQMTGRFLFFVRRSDLDVIFPPPQPEPATAPTMPPIAAPVSGAAWASRIAKQLKADGTIPDGIKQSPLARLIAQRMEQEAIADPSLGEPLKHNSIRNKLQEWGLWPTNSIK
jgi:hypothetical protein